jgi:hypothetical protein
MNIVFYDELFNPVEMELKSQKNSKKSYVPSESPAGDSEGSVMKHWGY